MASHPNPPGDCRTSAQPSLPTIGRPQRPWHPTPGRHWVTRQCRLLKAGRADDVLAGSDECDRAARYTAERRDRMRYDEYLAPGLPVGSEPGEAACKTVVRRRMTWTGMRWTVADANSVLWVRCARLSGWFDD